MARKVSRPRKAKKAKVAYVYRYNPDTKRRTKVRADSIEAETWSSTKPRAKPKSVKAAERRLETAAARTVERTVGRAGAKVAGVLGGAGSSIGLSAGLTAAYLASAGAVAYIATKAIMDAHAEGESLANLVAKARSLAATAFHGKFGRFPTREEYADLRKRVGNSIADAMAAQYGSIPAMWRNFIGLFKGA